MDDRFMHDLRREPAPEFARALRASLERAETGGLRRVFTTRAKWSALVAAVVVACVATTVPSVRAGAQAFLDLFRVANVSGIAFDASRLSDLSTLDLPRLLGERVEVLTSPDPYASFATPEEAGEAAGLDVLEPAWRPAGWERSSIEVSGEHAVRFTASADHLRGVLDALAIDDLTVPVGLDGQTATLRVPPVVQLTYGDGDRALRLLQARSPDVSFPAGVDLAELAEIALRILGLSRTEAYRVAQSVDWRSTLIVPVPAAAASFREVDVRGANGLIIEAAHGDETGNLLLWAAEGRVFAISGPLDGSALLEMAQTLQ